MPPRVTRNDWVTDHGSLLLLVVSVILFCLGLAFHQLRPFAFVGVVLFLLAVLLPRLEGRLKLSLTGVEAELRGVVDKDPVLSPAQKDEAVEFALEELRAQKSRTAAARAYESAKVAVLGVDGRARAWLEREGWTVRDVGEGVDADFIAQKGDDMVVVETKARSEAVGRSKLKKWFGRLDSVRYSHDFANTNPRPALFISAPGFTEKGSSAIPVAPLAVYFETAPGQFELLNKRMPSEILKLGTSAKSTRP